MLFSIALYNIRGTFLAYRFVMLNRGAGVIYMDIN
jgi:hypothetical protein